MRGNTNPLAYGHGDWLDSSALHYRGSPKPESLPVYAPVAKDVATFRQTLRSPFPNSAMIPS